MALRGPPIHWGKRAFRPIADIDFFDSHYELERANLLGGLVAIRKRGASRFKR